MVAQFDEELQHEVWANGPDVPIAAAIAPEAKVIRVSGGYRIGGKSRFASGIDHSKWAMVGGMVDKVHTILMIPSSDYTVQTDWHMVGMAGTGSNTIVTDDVFVPDNRVVKFSDLQEGKGPGTTPKSGPIFRLPFFSYSGLTFVAPMLGAAFGAYAKLPGWIGGRKFPDGTLVEKNTAVQVRIARAAADLDAADLLLRRTTQIEHEDEGAWRQILARSIRDFTRAAELTIAAMEDVVSLTGMAGFDASHPAQRAWRDIHFSAMHGALKREVNFACYACTVLGLPPDPNGRFMPSSAWE
jgi:alkylation response protein AidB-like acyl-CoA dehydrogenase